MFNNINIWLIIEDQLKTLKVYRSERTSIGDILLFMALPLLAALAIVVLLGFRLDVDAINALITSLSVFSGLLFNLLLLVFELLRKESAEKEEPSSLRITFLGQIHAHISFTILTAVITISLLLLLFIQFDWYILREIINVVVIFLVINFILTLLMILQRVHILIKREVPPPPPD